MPRNADAPGDKPAKPRAQARKAKKPPAKAVPRRRGPGSSPRYKLSPEVTAKLCDLLAMGMYEEPACKAVGVSTATYYRWRAEGEEAAILVREAAEAGRARPKLTHLQEAQLEVWEATERARGMQEAAYLGIIAAAGRGGAEYTEGQREYVVENGERKLVSERSVTKHLTPTWTAAAWILERRQPERWARRERMELTGAGGGPVESNVNVGAMAVNDPTIGAAVDRLLEAAVGHSTEQG